MSHTPTPWKVGRKGDFNFTLPIDYEGDQGIEVIAETSTDYWYIALCHEEAGNSTAQANAEHIVKCVNHHDELVGALRKFCQYFESGNSIPIERATIKARADAVVNALYVLEKVDSE